MMDQYHHVYNVILPQMKLNPNTPYPVLYLPELVQWHNIMSCWESANIHDQIATSTHILPLPPPPFLSLTYTHRHTPSNVLGTAVESVAPVGVRLLQVRVEVPKRVDKAFL